MRVLRLITRLNIGGPSIQAIDLTTRLVARGYETTLAHGMVAPGEGDMRYLLEGRSKDGYEVIQVDALQRPLAPLADIRAVWAVFRILRRSRPAIVHTHMAKAGTVGRIATFAHNRLLPRHARARVVHTYHGHVLDGYFSRTVTRVFIGIERILAAATDRIVAISPRIREELIGEHGIGRPEQYQIVPLGFDLDAFARIEAPERTAARTALDIPESAPVITTVGRLTAIKQQGLFLDVAKIVAERHPTAVFLIVGDGELRGELEEATRALGLAARVRFLGWRRDLPTIYAASDVFLLTSRNEGTPVALIESMAAGCAGVSTDVGGVRDVINEPDAGRVSPFGDAPALAAHVNDLIADEPTRRRVAAAGRARVLDRFGVGRLLNDIDGLYRDLLS